MAIKKKKNIVEKIVIFLYLAIFPFGQLLRREVFIGDFAVILQFIDLVSGAALLVFLIGKEKPTFWKIFTPFFGVLMFSLLYSLSLFNFREILPGVLYLIRLVAAYSLFSLAYILAQKERKISLLIFRGLILVVFLVSVFGWWQYFFYPDLRVFYYLGWDDHLHRLVGAFLDPGFTSIILVFGFLASFGIYLKERKKKHLALTFFFLLTLAFTYSRAGFLSLIAGATMLFKGKERKNMLLSLFSLLVLIIFLLPRPSSEGVKLERLSSVWGRIRNYRQTYHIWMRSPVFGVGYNNLCLAKIKFLQEDNAYSHSCSGSDSSLLFLLSTTGIVGLFIFSFLLWNLMAQMRNVFYASVFKSCLISLLLHSQFNNSLFYPWVVGWLLLLAAISLGSSTSSSGR